MMMRPPRTARPIAIAALLCGLALAASADAPAGKMLDLKSGSVTYTVIHKLHQVKGTSRKLEGRALVQPDGTARVQVRAPVASFDSGNANRDAHMREVTHELNHRYVSVKGKLAGLAWPLPGPVETSLEATVELNGEKQAIAVPVKLVPQDGKVKATFGFPFSLTAFKVERPELLLIKVNDQARLEGELIFEEGK